MLSKTYSYGILGIDAFPVEIEVDVTRGLPAISLVGLADTAIKESKDRVRSALKNSGFKFPADRITVNLAPADVKKGGVAYDLAIALGILAASDQIRPESIRDFIFIGELALNGDLRDINGSLAIALALRRRRIKKIILPPQSALEAAIVQDIEVFRARSLREVVDLLLHPETLSPLRRSFPKFEPADSDEKEDLSDVQGQFAAKRALEIAASGGHNILMIGPPGSGKTMLAKRLIGLLPPLSEEESLETTRVHSTVGLIDRSQGLILKRPWRAPHPTISDVALVGGGSIPQPGEISLAHNGVLFMDELPEFHRNVLEVLRQPLEEGIIHVARASRSLIFPARFMLVAAMNPCPCGHFGNPEKACRCTHAKVEHYRGKISGPLLERIDIHLEIPMVPYQDLAETKLSESSKTVGERVGMARRIQEKRFLSERARTNAEMPHRLVKKFCPLAPPARELLRGAMARLKLSARAHDKVLKISRTIADLGGSEEIEAAHIAEAIQYRCLDRES